MSYAYCFIIAILIVTVIWDLRFRRIPNWVNLPSLIVGIVYHTFTGGQSGLVFSLLGMVVGFCFFFLFYVMGGMGAGDVKLMTAIGALLGPADVLYACAYTAIAGGIYAVILIVVQKENRRVLARYVIMAKAFVTTGHFATIPRSERAQSTPLCYGVAIAAGTITVLVQRIFY